MASEQWGPDVEEVRAENRRNCKHLRQGPRSRTVGAGGGRIGCRTETYRGCLDCDADLSVSEFLALIQGEDDNPGPPSPTGETPTSPTRDGEPTT